MQIYQKNKENRSIADIPRVQIQGVYWSILTELKKKKKKKKDLKQRDGIWIQPQVSLPGPGRDRYFYGKSPALLW